MKASYKIAVVGSASFLAKHFIRAAQTIKPASKILLLDRSQCDITDKGQLKEVFESINVDYVVNFAGISTVTGSDSTKIYNTNAFGQANLLEALKNSKFRGRHLFVSSANIYGSRERTFLESDEGMPQNHYACSKMLGEKYCDWYKDEFDIVIARPFNCVGAGQQTKFLVPKLVQAFANGDAEIRLGNLGIQRDFVDARDAVSILFSILHHGERGGVYNVSNNQTNSIQELISILELVSGCSPDIRSVPEFCRSNDLMFQCGDNTLARGLGYERRFTIEETLNWMLSAVAARTDES
jgi:nucleoside-diphosphate-sugar epimerase